MNTRPEEQQAEGNWDKAKGRVKEAGGALTGDGDLKAEGQWDQTKGEFKKGVGEIREKIRDNI
ncbi:MAG TPA: CsbD family protein [Rhodothermales bacterium]|nr:CsbD family protein [Rhodothermales bacterium]